MIVAGKQPSYGVNIKCSCYHRTSRRWFAAFIHGLTQKLGILVDLVCMTNGEGGFRYSAPSEYLYGNLELSNEIIGRQHLPRIRQQELIASGRILGIRKFFFFNEIDLKKDLDVNAVLNDQWDKELLIQLLTQTIKKGNSSNGYDLMLIMLPNSVAHAHHTASGLIALETIERLYKIRSSIDVQIPTVIAGSEFIVGKQPSYSLNSLQEISSVRSKDFRFYRTWTLSNKDSILNYHLITIWACSEHKSQGHLISETLTKQHRDFEQYFYLAINDKENDLTRREKFENLFEKLSSIHR